MNRPWSGVALAQLQALVLLAGSSAWVWRELEVLLPNDRVAGFLGLEQALGSTLGLQLAAFGAAVLLSHAAFGLLVFALARLSEAAFPGGTSARRGWLITGWFVVMAGLVMAANTTWRPASIFSGEESWWRGLWFGLYPVQAAAIVIGLVVICLVTLAIRRMRSRGRFVAVTVTSTVFLAFAAGLVLPDDPDAAAPVAATSPHLVIIGIDSLRNDLTLPRLGKAKIPHVEAFLAEARNFSDATSPL
ncbi:MAG: hypothetical protein ACRESW_12295, partial [Nevskiales bacterium]